MVFLSFSMILVVPLLASSAVSALITPLARDKSLVARHPHRHRHLARQADGHSLARRSARRKRCLHRSTLPASLSLSSSPSSFSYSPAVVTTTASSGPVLDLPINVAPPAPPATTTTTPAAEQPAYTPPPQEYNTIVASSSTGSGETHHGEGTFFDVGLGSCGKTSTNTDYMVAIGWELYDSFATGPSVNNPNLNPVCNRQIRATYGGKSVTVVVLDRCGGCKRDDLDFSPSAFSQLADQGLGRLKDVQWQFV